MLIKDNKISIHKVHSKKRNLCFFHLSKCVCLFSCSPINLEANCFIYSVETTNLEGTTETSAQNTQMMVEQGSSTHRMSLSGANKRMFHLLKRARVQLIKIDQQKQLKSAQVRMFNNFMTANSAFL